MNKIELKEMVGGALQEQFAKAFENVVENLQNPNTPYKNSREITIKLKFTQNEWRDDVKCAVQVAEKLAPQTPMETSFAIGKNLKTGEIYAEEYGKQLKGQVTLDDIPATTTVDGMEVDTETGEVVNQQSDEASTSSTLNVIDFRKAN